MKPPSACRFVFAGLIVAACGAQQPASTPVPTRATTAEPDSAMADDAASNDDAAPVPDAAVGAALAGLDAGTPPASRDEPSDAGARPSRPGAAVRTDGGATAHHPAGSNPIAHAATDAGAPRPAANGALAAGRAQFDRACGRCHPGGAADSGPRLIGIAWSESRLRTQVRSGGGTMRAIGPARLSDADLAAVVTYLRSLRTVQ